MSEYSEIRRIYKKIEDHIPTMIYEPMYPGKKASVAVVLMHSDGDYFEFWPAKALAERGYRVFAAHFEDPSIPLDQKLVQLGKVTAFAKSWNGVEKMLVLGHSGGATLMSAYQAVAENGAQVFQGKEKIIPLDDIGELIPADGVMFLDSNFGNGAMSLLSLDPSVLNEKDGVTRDASLNLFNPANGYSTKEEECHFTDEFIRKYLAAQGARMNRLIDYCQERVKLIDAGRGLYKDDEPLLVPGGNQYAPMNKLFPQVTKFLSHTKGEWPLIHKDGSVTVRVVPCEREFRAGFDTTGEYGFGALKSTVKTFLKSSAVRAKENFGYDETHLFGVDWDSSYCTTTGNAAHISAPMLAMGMTGSYEYIAAEGIYERAVKCADKSLAFVEGASHNFVPNEETGDWGDTVKTCFDYVDQWIGPRFVQ